MIVGSGIIGAAHYGLAIPGILLVISKANLSWFGEAYSIGSSYGVSRVFFEPVTLGAFGVMIALGVVFWAVGSRSRRRGLTGETAPVSEPAGPAA
jgi:hypothetical protein